MKTAIVAGSTGLVGSHLLEILLPSTRYQKVIAITRAPLEIHHSKLEVLMAGSSDLETALKTTRADDVFCAIGTTMAKARTKEKFYEIDFTYPLTLGRVMLANGATQFLLVSALGANTSSAFYYNQVKGQAEDAIGRLGYPTLQIFRPSLLLGSRKEDRPGEDAAKIFYKIFGFLIPAKYKGIQGSVVAKAMLYYASLERPGTHIHESRDLLKLETEGKL